MNELDDIYRLTFENIENDIIYLKLIKKQIIYLYYIINIVKRIV